MKSFAAVFDPGRMTSADANSAVEDLAEIEAMAQACKAAAAARVSESSIWKQGGYRSAADALARQTGSTVAAARDILETGRRFSSQLEIARAARRGEISFSQASLISDAAEADPRSEKRLLAAARRDSMAILRDECELTKSRARPDPEAHHHAIHRRRYLRNYIDRQGMWHLHAGGNKEDGAQIMAAIESKRDEVFNLARKEGRSEASEAYDFDALVEAAKDSTSSSPARRGSARKAGESARRGAAVKLLVRIDYDTFLRGAVQPDETCELVGYGPVSASVVRGLIAQQDPFVAAIMTRGKSLVGVAHLGRKPTAHQRSALEWLYPSCAAEGCHAQAHLEIDHRVDWSKTHFTMLDCLDTLCHHHHRLKTTQDWALVEGSGKRAFVSPDDERHPGHRRKRE